MSVPIKASFTTKRHSRRPYIRLLVTDKDGNDFDFSDASSVRFVMHDLDGVEKINAAASIETPATSGVLRYEWKAVDVDTAGEYHAEFDVLYPGGEILTLPLDGDLLVTIYEDVNNA